MAFPFCPDNEEVAPAATCAYESFGRDEVLGVDSMVCASGWMDIARLTMLCRMGADPLKA